MRRKKYARISPQEGIVNLTPLIDVVFVVLIAFIVIAPLFDIENISLYKKNSHNLASFKKDAICIYVKKDNSIIIENQKISSTELDNFLKNLKLRYPEKRVSLFHDKNAFFGTYQMIKESLEKAGFKNLDLVLKNS